MRACPICRSIDAVTIHAFKLTSGEFQEVYQCLCGMVYASVMEPVNYITDPIYSAPGAIGSGVSDFDHIRLANIYSSIIADYCSKESHIVDLGCAQGGLLTILASRQYKNISGIEINDTCRAIACAKGHTVLRTLDDISSHIDMLIMSHVLEHLVDVRGMLAQIYSNMSMRSCAYIEVPDSASYYNFRMPFFDFNGEHINHFDLSTLTAVVNIAGFFVAQSGRKSITLPNGSVVPAIFVVVKKRSVCHPILQYISNSLKQLADINDKLVAALAGEDKVILWGAGEYLCHISNLSVFQEVKIVQIVDRNPALIGRAVLDVHVEHPDNIRKDIPIVISTIVSSMSIRTDIAQRQLSNKVISPMENL